MDLEANIREYLHGGATGKGRHPHERYTSFDYCYNYFQSFRETGRLAALTGPDHLEASCLQLGFYLASWGMLRGSSTLLEKSARYYEPIIHALAAADPRLWEIDAHCYTPGNILLLRQFGQTIARVWGAGTVASDILVTKIMLGVFGNIPAFDSIFKAGLGVSVFGRRALEKVAAFYASNSEIIEKYRVPTLEFLTGQPTRRLYSRAKVIDMAFFIEGARAHQGRETTGQT